MQEARTRLLELADYMQPFPAGRSARHPTMSNGGAAIAKAMKEDGLTVAAAAEEFYHSTDDDLGLSAQAGSRNGWRHGEAFRLWYNPPEVAKQARGQRGIAQPHILTTG